MKANGHTKIVNDESVVDGRYRTRSAPGSEVIREPKSTNGFPVPPVVKLGLRAAEAVSPNLAAALLERLFLTPRRHGATGQELEWLAGARSFPVTSGKHDLVAWSAGSGPTVLLVHGWSGRGAQLGAFIAPLLKAGFRVVTFDAPGHGRSTGRRSSVVEIAQAVIDVAGAAGPLHAVVAHSIGTAATTVALRKGLNVERLVYLSPPGHVEYFLSGMATLFGLRPETARLAKERIENRFGVAWWTLEPFMLAGSMTAPLDIFHDREDREVPWAQAQALAERWPGSRLNTTVGLGHKRIIKDPDVIAYAVRFIGEREESLPSVAPTVKAPESIF